MFDHLLDGSGGQCHEIGETAQKALVVGDDCSHLGLLQHDF
jgi:hypothetical protein